jgi:hypothetical protein
LTEVAKLLLKDQVRLEDLGFNGTPSFLIGTKSFGSVRSYEEMPI